MQTCEGLRKACVWDEIDYENDALIEASAGTGKTYALERIVLKLICEKGFSAGEILLVTYTEKAAGELKDRIRRALASAGKLGDDFEEMTICTIHSFCQRLLGEYAFENGIPMECEIGADAGGLAREAVVSALKDDRLAADTGKNLSALLHEANIAKAGELAGRIEKIIRASDARRQIAGLMQKAELAEQRALKGKKPKRDDAGDLLACRLALLAQEKFEALKRERSMITFDDMVALASKAVAGETRNAGEAAAQKRFREAVRRQYRVALVDEFQDTDEAQWNIFRTLFSSKENTGAEGRPRGFLLVVGDPKQAIYSFRGADVQVYCNARDCIAQRKTLGETYRAKQSLVDAFNVFFGRSGWFADGGAGAGISYCDVSYPADGNAKFNALEEADPEPVKLVESLPGCASPSAGSSSGFGNSALCLSVFLENAAREMLRLRSLAPAYSIVKGEPGERTPGYFRYSDMCVLVRTKADAARARKTLARHGIPYVHYKQSGIYDSAAAEAVLALLEYIAAPEGRGNRATLLLSQFFGCHPAGLRNRTERDEAEFDSFMERLMELAAAKKWNRLFDLAMNGEAVALVHPGDDICAFNRTRAAIRQIFDALLAACGRSAAGIADFIGLLREWRRNGSGGDEAEGLYEKESDADCVQIMTMHASKGLQFPVVFLASGLSRIVKAEAEEARRILYVALTRAEHRLYLPWSSLAWEWSTEKGPGCGIGSKGSALLACDANGFLGRAIMQYFPEGARAGAFISPGTVAPNAIPVPGSSSSVSRGAEAVEIELPRNLKSRRVRWDSFSSLSRHGALAGESTVPEVEGATPDENETHDIEAATSSLLPRNNISGNAFHEIMERLCKNDASAGEVDFTSACDEGMAADDSPLMQLIRRRMRANFIADREKDGDSTARTLLRMVQAALRTRIKIGETEFSLSSVARSDRLAEVEFVADEARLFSSGAKTGEGALNGKIDLIVRIGGKVFILDWKTNSLPDYSAASLAGAMEQAHYDLQYKLYAVAASSWLGSSPLEVCGVAYLFARAADSPGASGVYSKAFAPGEIDAMREALRESGAIANPEGGAHDGA